MRSIILAAAALSLSACATTNDLAATEADDFYISAKPIDEISRCLELLANRPERVDPYGRRFVQVVNGNGHTLATLTLIPVETGTRVEMRRANSFNLLGNWRKCD